MSSEAKLYTINIRSPSEYVNMANPTTSRNLQIKNYRFEFDYTGVAVDDYYKVIYVSIGSATNLNYFIDNILGRYELPLMCDNGYVDPVSFRSVTFSGGQNIEVTLSSNLESAFTVTLTDESGTVIDAAILKHSFIQFNYF